MRQPSMHGERGGTWSAINQPSISHQCTGSAVARVGACGHGGCAGDEDMGQSAAMGASHARKPTLGSRGASGRRHANNRRTTPLPLATQQHIGTSLILKHEAIDWGQRAQSSRRTAAESMRWPSISIHESSTERERMPEGQPLSNDLAGKCNYHPWRDSLARLPARKDKAPVCGKVLLRLACVLACNSSPEEERATREAKERGRKGHAAVAAGAQATFIVDGTVDMWRRPVPKEPALVE